MESMPYDKDVAVNILERILGSIQQIERRYTTIVAMIFLCHLPA